MNNIKIDANINDDRLHAAIRLYSFCQRRYFTIFFYGRKLTGYQRALQLFVLIFYIKLLSFFFKKMKEFWLIEEISIGPSLELIKK